MRSVIHLKFSADVESVKEAWDIAEGLEKAAMSRGYVAVTGWVEDSGDGRSGVLVPEGQEPVATEAGRLERVPGLVPTRIADGDNPSEGSISPAIFGSQD